MSDLHRPKLAPGLLFSLGMQRNRTTSLLLLGAACAAMLGTPNLASADCRPGARRCKKASIQLNIPGHIHFSASASTSASASASASLGIGVPRQVVVVRPQAQITVRHPQVIVRPAPAPILVQQQAPRTKNFGVRLALGGMGGDVNMVGGQLAFKYRPRMGFFALEAAAGLYGGDDYNDFDRVETPVTLGAQFYFNPRSRFQIFALVGVGASIASVQGYGDYPSGYVSDEYTYIGGFAGLGAEIRLGSWFALSGDLRGFLRDRTDFGADANPEFYDPATGKTTNTSMGLLATFGGTFYF